MPKPRPRVRSFDVFDTLVARRCVSSREIFRLVEKESGVAGFAKARVAAEVAVEHSAYTIDDIYEELQAILQLTADAAEELKSRELSCELDQTIPIAENMAAVSDGDLLVSDMFWHPAQISALVSRAGLDKSVDLRVSSSGKRTGDIWPKLLREYEIIEHLGDNRIGDYKSPRRSGIPARLTGAHRMTKAESALDAAGLTRLARAARETRLRTWNGDPKIRSLQLIQSSYNLPLLLISSIWLLRVADQAGYDKVLMSSRDCWVWQKVFDQVCSLSESEVRSEYFYTSRISRLDPSESYQQYANSRLREGSVWVDLCGTGWSMWGLLEHLGKPEHPTHLVHPTAHKPNYRGLEGVEVNDSGPRFDDSLIAAGSEGVRNSLFEMCNQAPHPMTLDVKVIEGAVSPVFAEDSRSAETLSAVAAQVEVAESFTATMSRELVLEVESLGSDQLQDLALQLYRLLTLEKRSILDVFETDLVKEDFKVLESLDTHGGTGKRSRKLWVSGVLNTYIRGPLDRLKAPTKTRSALRAMSRIGRRR